jgi:hypothetical protein
MQCRGLRPTHPGSLCSLPGLPCCLRSIASYDSTSLPALQRETTQCFVLALVQFLIPSSILQAIPHQLGACFGRDPPSFRQTNPTWLLHKIRSHADSLSQLLHMSDARCRIGQTYARIRGRLNAIARRGPCDWGRIDPKSIPDCGINGIENVTKAKRFGFHPISQPTDGTHNDVVASQNRSLSPVEIGS